MQYTFSQIYIQVIFSTKNRTPLVREDFRDELEKFICGIIKSLGSKPLAIYCNPDHIHILIDHKSDQSISAMVQRIKTQSSKWVNSRNLVYGKFQWQRGFGAFSYSNSEVYRVIQYIRNQPNHHKKPKFKDVFINLLNELKVDYDPNYFYLNPKQNKGPNSKDGQHP